MNHFITPEQLVFTLLFLFIFSPFFAQNTDDCNVSIHVNPFSPIDKTYEASEKISSDAVLNSGLNMSFSAGNEIELQPNFAVENGATFCAYIEGCIIDPMPCGETLWTPLGKDWVKFIGLADQGVLNAAGQSAVEGDVVMTILDQSGNENHAVSTSTTRAPVLRVENGLPVLQLETSSALIKTPSLQIKTLYAVTGGNSFASVKKASAWQRLLAGSDGGQPYVSTQIGSSGLALVGQFARDGRVNGGFVTSGILPLPLSVLRIESDMLHSQEWSLGFTWPAPQYAYVLTTGEETDAEARALEGWLAHRVGIQDELVENHPYRVFAPTVECISNDVFAGDVFIPRDIQNQTISTGSGTWRVSEVPGGYRWTLDENPAFESFMAFNDTDSEITKVVGGQTFLLPPHTVKFSQNQIPVQMSATRIRGAIADKRWIPYDINRADTWPDVFEYSGALQQYQNSVYDPASMNGTNSSNNLVGVISAQGGEYTVSRGAIDDADAEIIDLALKNNDVEVSSYTQAMYNAAFAFSGYPHRTPFRDGVLRDPQKPISGVQYEHRNAANETIASIESTIQVPGWSYDTAHSSNTGWALWLGTEDPRIGMIIQSHLAFSMATRYEYQRLGHIGSDGNVCAYTVQVLQSRATYNSMNCIWRARDVARITDTDDVMLWSEERVDEMYIEVDQQLMALLSDIDSGNDLFLKACSSPTTNNYPYVFYQGNNANEITLRARSNFMDQQYGAVPLYIRSLAGEAVGIDMMTRMLKHHIARTNILRGSQGIDGMRASSIPIGPDTGQTPFTNETEWAQWLKALDIRGFPDGGVHTDLSFNDSYSHTSIQTEFLLLAGKDLVDRGIIPAIPNLDLALQTFANFKAVTTSMSFRIWPKHTQTISQ